MKRRDRGNGRPVIVRALRFMALLLVAALVLILCMAQLGLPQWLQNYVLTHVDTGPYAFEASSIRLSLLEGIVLSDVELYKKRVVGPPALQAKRAVIELDAWALLAGRPPLRRVALSDGDFKPGMLVVLDPVGEQPPLPTDFGTGPPFSVAVHNFNFEGIVIGELRGVVRRNGNVLHMDDAAAVVSRGMRRGTVRGHVEFTSDALLLTGDLEVVSDPHVFLPLLQHSNLSFVRDLIGRFAFSGAAPRGTFTFRSVCKPRSPFFAEGDVSMQDGSYRNVDLLRLDSHVALDFSGTNVTVQLDRLMVVRPEGLATGGFTVFGDENRCDITFEGTSSIHPCAVSRIIGVLTNQFCRTLTFGPPFRMVAKGRVDLRHPVSTDFSSRWECGSVMANGLTVENASFDAGMQGLTCRIEDLRGKLCDGVVTGGVDFILAGVNPGPVHYDVKARLTGADFKTFMAVLGAPDKDYEGTLSARLDLSGLTGHQAADSLSGTGAIAVEDGRVFMLPVFGGLSEYMTRAIPGMDFVLRQGDANAKFVIADRQIRSDRIQVEGGFLTFTGNGAYHFNRELEFDAELTLFKSHTFMGRFIRIPTYLISKLFEFRVRGTLDKPEWYPVNFSQDILEKLGLKGSKSGDIGPPGLDKQGDSAVDSQTEREGEDGRDGTLN